MKYFVYFISLLCLACVISFAPYSCAQESVAPIAETEEKNDETPPAPTPAVGWTNLIYFTGIGCPHCAHSDPVVLKSRLRKGDVMVFEYEIYRDNVNGPLLAEYNKAYGAKLAVPQIIALPKETGIISGDTPVLKSLDTLIALYKGNDIVLADRTVNFDDLSFVKLPYKPKIWFKDRMAVREDSASLQSDVIKTFLIEGVVPEECKPEKKAEAPLSGGKVRFKEACRYDGWVLMHD